MNHTLSSRSNELMLLGYAHRRAVMYFLMCVGVTGCGSGSSSVGASQNPALQPDVYVAGVETVGNLHKAVYWKNGVITHLDSGAYGAWATGVAAANGHVYVSGFAGDAGNYQVAVLWTDGVETLLSPTSAGAIGTATGVAISGTDVYVSGTFEDTSQVPVQEVAEYWKNGTPVVVSQPGVQATAGAIALNGSDVYVLGTLLGPVPGNGGSYSSLPTVWKNSVATSLIGNSAYATPAAITVSGGHVYVAGSYCVSFGPNCEIAAYWQDGTLVPVQKSPASQASGIAISQGSPYVTFNLSVSGGVLPEVTANGTVTPLASDTYASTYGMTAYGSDVYIVGEDYYGPSIWKNNVMSYLPGAQGGSLNSTATAVAVVPAS